MKLTHLLPLAAATAFSATSASAAVITISDLSQTPTNSPTQQTQVNVLNDAGADLLPNSNGNPPVYLITTFTFGAGSQTHIRANFNATGGQNRLGIEVQDNGLVQFINQGDPGDTTFNIATFNGDSSVAGYMGEKKVTLIVKQFYDTSNDSLRATLGTSDDTLMTAWVNPTLSSVEGSGISAGDMHTLWNSATYRFFTQTIQNQTTAGGAGNSTITNTVILTGADATFANALSYAVPVPEPAAALLGAFGGLLLLRRRR